MKAVIFDMDGVIVQSEEHWRPAMERILEASVADAESVDPSTLVGINVLEQYDVLAADHDLTVTRDEYFELYDEQAATVLGEQAELLDGFRDLVAELRDRGLRIGLATSSFPGWVDIVMDRFELADGFDAVVTAMDIDGPGKPEPHIYEHTADRLGVDPTEAVVVEDSTNGVLGASRAGAYTIGYQPAGGSDQDHSAADAVAEGPADLRRTLLEAVDGRPPRSDDA